MKSKEDQIEDSSESTGGSIQDAGAVQRLDETDAESGGIEQVLDSLQANGPGVPVIDEASIASI